MTRIVVLGGTGYAGSAITTEASSRGHEVTVFSRNAPAELAAGVTSVTGSALAQADLQRAVAGAEVIVVSLAPNGELEDEFQRVNTDIAGLAVAGGARLGVVGGAGTLLLTPKGPKAFDAPSFPEKYRGFSLLSDSVLQTLRGSDTELDWFVLSPPEGFGRYLPGESTGHYQVGGDVVMSTGETRPAISAADFAIAFVDEIERPAHRRQRFTVAH